MGLFRRRRPLHERLLEEGGLAVTPEHDARPAAQPPVRDGGHVEGVWGNREVHPARSDHARESGIHGIARQREWDAVATVRAPQIAGRELGFEVLPDRTVLVEEEQGDAELAPLADAIERELQPPYRARAVRQGEGLWAVAARAIEVVQLRGRNGQTIELAAHGDERSLSVDGSREFGTIPELEALGAERHRDYVVRAERLDGDWWEVRIDPL
jgi:hypothetical protein